jgi:hypothetical protein
MYDKIKETFINNFLNKHYLWTCCSTKRNIIDDIKTRCPFSVNCSNENSIEIKLDDTIRFNVNLTWEEKKNKDGETFGYRLVKIS